MKLLAPVHVVLANCRPKGSINRSVHAPKLLLLATVLIFCPAVPSNSISPILLAVPIEIAWAVLTDIRPIKLISAAAWVPNGTKKSCVLVPLPFLVDIEIRPDAAVVGTVEAREVAVPELGNAEVRFSFRL